MGWRRKTCEASNVLVKRWCAASRLCEETYVWNDMLGRGEGLEFMTVLIIRPFAGRCVMVVVGFVLVDNHSRTGNNIR
jgi:hypothetical protein